MNNTNQASEIAEQIIQDFRKWHDGQWDYNGDDPRQKGTKTIQSLIRTEKLKAQTAILQEGISESKEFCGEDVDINLGWVNFKLNELQQSLDKLEAGL